MAFAIIPGSAMAGPASRAKLHLGKRFLGLLWIQAEHNPIYYQWYRGRPSLHELPLAIPGPYRRRAPSSAGRGLTRAAVRDVLLLSRGTKKQHNEPRESSGKYARTS